MPEAPKGGEARAGLPRRHVAAGQIAAARHTPSLGPCRHRRLPTWAGV